MLAPLSCILFSASSPADLFFDSLYVSTAEGFDFAAELEVTADLLVVEDAEAVDNSDRSAGPFEHV